MQKPSLILFNLKYSTVKDPENAGLTHSALDLKLGAAEA